MTTYYIDVTINHPNDEEEDLPTHEAKSLLECQNKIGLVIDAFHNASSFVFTISRQGSDK